MDVISSYNLKVDVLKLGVANPLANQLVADFLREHKKVIVVEELDPILEGKIRTLAQLLGISISINGKMDGCFPYAYEYNPDRVAIALSKIMGFQLHQNQTIAVEETMPARPPVMCSGCPHRGTFYAVKLVTKQLGLRDVIYPNDIGCYTLGVQKPYLEADYLLCMGSSAGTACGFSKTTQQKVVAFIGDSTFFHGGIPGLINAVHNNHKLTMIILDNRTTAMTGNQSNPGVPMNALQEEAPEVSIEEIVKAAGVKSVRTIDPYDEKSAMLAVKDAFRFDGVSVVISKRECALLRDARLRSIDQHSTYDVNQNKCISCMNCVTNFSCPSFYLDTDGLIRINPDLCDGCGVCAETLICPPRAIEVRKP